MPESVLHDEIAELLKAILAHWAREQQNVQIARNLAIRWDEDEPAIGVESDVCVLSPAIPRTDDEELRSVRTWLPGHTVPRLAIEIVSTTNPKKDYVIAPDKYAASGTRELWVFDPLLAGPHSHGGPFVLQIWSRDDEGRFVRRHAGEAPAYSEVLAAYVVTTDDGRRLRIAGAGDGSSTWLTDAEAAQAGEARALDRVAELEAMLKMSR